MAFQDRTVIITGAAGGIGRALALQLAARGARLVLADLSEEPLQETVRLCRTAGGEALAVPTDVTDVEACRRLIDKAVQAYGGIDILVANAGISMWSRFDEVDDLAVFERLMQVNYFGALYCTHAALPHLKARHGLIVAMGSYAGRTGVPTRSGYAAAKHAVQGFFDSLRIELQGSGVDVLVVCPGFVATDIRAHALGADGQPLRTSKWDESKGLTPLATCVQLIVAAMARRQRELFMTTKEQLGLVLKALAPGLFDRITAGDLAARDGS
jgi:NAD(P)-dependent dehydrogenase (short-subunit alcohol dehydrogenase family)